MTPKEKAEDLVNKYLTSRDANQLNDVRDIHSAIRCALIAVDEVMQKTLWDKGEQRFWKEVKKEIELL